MSPAYRQRKNSSFIISILLFHTTLVLLSTSDGSNNAGLVQCSSSYYYDHLQPTAKRVLNNIASLLPRQQQEEAITTESSTTQGRSSEPATTIGPQQEQPDSKSRGATGVAADERSAQPDWTRKPEESQGLPEEPDRNEFVNLQVRPDEVTSTQGTFDVSPQRKSKTDGNEEGDTQQRQRDEQQATVVSTSESVSDDPTTALNSNQEYATQVDVEPPTTSKSVSESGTRADDDSVPQAPEGARASGQSTTTTTTETAMTTTTLTSTTERQQQSADPKELAVIETNQIGVGGSAKSPADADSVRETELEAIAAVDASMGFGDSFANQETTDACYDEYGNARYCEPEFENVALERQVEASSECGHPPSRFCTTYLNEHNDQIRNCHICDAQRAQKRHPAAYLTDMNNSNNPTCWVSAPISAQTAPPPGNNTPGQQDSTRTPGRDNVTLTLNLDKRYEITYISMQFCSLKPDSLAIWRSVDFGQTWSPYQFYSSQCEQLYGRRMATGAGSPPTPVAMRQSQQQASSESPFEATCVSTTGPAWSAAPGRIAFSTLDAFRASNNSLAPQSHNPLRTGDKSSPLHDWMTATNIKIVLDRHQASWIQSSLAHHPHHHRSSRLAVAASSSLSAPQNEASGKQMIAMNNSTDSQQLETSLTNPSDTYNYALSDLTVGGRCKCNGHASRCVHNADGKLQCDCQHNTDGPDCERCLPLHHDRPWQRATEANANPCQPCNCNGHSRKCRFDPELYLLSGKRSGGVCIDCRDNTTGRHCHYCKEGHTRDHSRPMSDKGACKPCDCHPVGSLGKVCNQTTGQCPCKEGVTGLECNRCASGYQQSNSPSEPCIRLPENDINYEPTIEVDNEQANSVVSHQLSGDQDPGLQVSAVDDQRTQPTSTRNPLEVASRQQQPLAKPAADSELAHKADGLPRQQADEYGQRHRQPIYDRPYRWPQHQVVDKGMSGGNFYGADRHRGRAQTQFVDPSLQQDEYDDMGLERATSAAGQSISQLDDPEDYQMNPRQLYGIPLTGGDFYQDKRQGFVGYRPHLRGRPSLANLDHDGREDNYDPSSGLYGRHDQVAPLGSIYSGNSVEDLSFNQIRPSHMRRQHQGPLRALNGARPRHSGRRVSADTDGSSMLASDQIDQQALQQAMRRAATCADCQSNTKRISFEKFCHLEYAIRATLLSKQIANDWTRYDVEIQDTFKSPSLNSLVTPTSPDGANLVSGVRPPLKSKNLVLDSGYQSDDPGSLSANLNQTQKGASEKGEGRQANSEQQTQHPIHRLIIGSVQSIWIPTEDVACKCPRLKMGASYLLMGLVDTKENSATSIQLDRHGVAIEWKSSLQSKLIRYQRRHSRGNC